MEILQRRYVWIPILIVLSVIIIGVSSYFVTHQNAPQQRPQNYLDVFPISKQPQVPSQMTTTSLSAVPPAAFLYSRNNDPTGNDRSVDIVAATDATTSLYHLSGYSSALSSASYSRTSGRVAYVASINEPTDVPNDLPKETFLMLLDRGVLRVVSKATAQSAFVGEGLGSPVLTPDGSRIAYTYSHVSATTTHVELWQIQSDGMNNKIVSSDVLPQMPLGNNGIQILGWSPDGQRIFFKPFCACDRPTATSTYSINSTDGKIEMGHDMDAVSPNGLTALLVKHSYVGADNKDISEDGIFLVDLNNGTEKRLLVDSIRSFGQMAWSPDGTHVLYSAAHKGEIQYSGFDGSPYRSLDQYSLYTLDLSSAVEKKILDFSKTWLPTQVFWINSRQIAYIVDKEPNLCCTIDYRRLYTLDLSANTPSHLIDSSDSDGITILGEYHQAH